MAAAVCALQVGLLATVVPTSSTVCPSLSTLPWSLHACAVTPTCILGLSMPPNVLAAPPMMPYLRRWWQSTCCSFCQPYVSGGHHHRRQGLQLPRTAPWSRGWQVLPWWCHKGTASSQLVPCATIHQQWAACMRAIATATTAAAWMQQQLPACLPAPSLADACVPH